MSRKMGCALAALLLGSILLIVLVIWLSSPSSQSRPTPTALAQMTGTAQSGQLPTRAGPVAIGRRTKTNGCVANGSLPDAACTPGEVLTTDAKAVCTPGYSGKVRDVTASESARVYAEYGIASHSKGQYEVDHLISLELGGSNGVANLWPEAANGNPGFHEKDRVENFLHSQVCSGAISLQTAQHEIATNWVAIYNAMGP